MALHPLNFSMKSLSNFELIYVPKFKIYARKSYFRIVRPCYVHLKRVPFAPHSQHKRDNLISKINKTYVKHKLPRKENNSVVEVANDDKSNQKNVDKTNENILESYDETDIEVNVEIEYVKINTQASTNADNNIAVLKEKQSFEDSIINDVPLSPLSLSDPEISSTNTENGITTTHSNTSANNKIKDINDDTILNTNAVASTDDVILDIHDEIVNNSSCPPEKTQSITNDTTANVDDISADIYDTNTTDDNIFEESNNQIESQINELSLHISQEFENTRNHKPKKRRKKRVYSVRSKRRKIANVKNEDRLEDLKVVDEQKEDTTTATLDSTIELCISIIYDKIVHNFFSETIDDIRLSQNVESVDQNITPNIESNTISNEFNELEDTLKNQINENLTKEHIIVHNETIQTTTSIPIKSIYILLKKLNILSFADDELNEVVIAQDKSVVNEANDVVDNENSSATIQNTLECCNENEQIISKCPIFERPETPQTPLTDEKPHNHLSDDDDLVSNFSIEDTQPLALIALARDTIESNKIIDNCPPVESLQTDLESFNIDLLIKSNVPYILLKKVQLDESNEIINIINHVMEKDLRQDASNESDIVVNGATPSVSGHNNSPKIIDFTDDAVLATPENGVYNYIKFNKLDI